MYVLASLLPRLMRRLSILVTLAIAAALLPIAFAPAATAATGAAAAKGASALAPIPTSSTSTDFPTGSLIIDMGASPQTISNGLKPYGFVYELLTTHKIPVAWAIKDGKASMGASDFTVSNVVDINTNATIASKTFAGSSFIISGDFAGDLPAARLTYWKGQGVKIYRSTAPVTGVPQFSLLRSWPRIVLDDDSGAVADNYYSNAGIPTTAYRFALPSALTACDDLFVFPHADPTWALHKKLLDFNNSGGFIFGQCHAPSVLENIDDPADAGTAPNMNFLSVNGLVPFGDHEDGTLPYTYRADWSDPIQQITAHLDTATENGSEQIFLPKAGGWRPSTQILVSDPDHPELNGGSGDDLSPGKAAVTAYGRGFGNSSNGLVMYQAAHDFAKSSGPANVSAQRTFMNFNLLSGIERAITTNATVPAGPMTAGETKPVSATATGGSGTYTYAWTSSCGGTFANSTAASTTFTAPTLASSTACTIRVTVTDSCGRVSFDAKSVTVNPPPPPSPSLSLDKSVSDASGDGVAQLGETLTYSFSVTNTGNVALTNVTITDAKLSMTNVVCTSSLAVGQTKPCATTKTYVVTAADIAAGKVTNEATASATPPTGSAVTAKDTVVIQAPATPAISLVKSVVDASGDGVAQLGETLTYTFKVTNSGNVPLTNVTISDPKLSMSNEVCVANLAVGETKTCPTKTYVVTAADIAAGKVDNLATAKGTPPSGDPVTGTGTATIPAPATPAVKIVKSVSDANNDNMAQLGEVLTYTFTVTNTGNVPLTDLKLTDPKLNLSNVNCESPSTALAVGASTTCTALTAAQKKYTVTNQDVSNGTVDNTVTVSATPPTGGPVSGTSTVTIATQSNSPAIHVVKSVSDASGDGVAQLGEVLTYTFTVTNSGNVPLNNVKISDVKLGLSNANCEASLAVGAQTTCSLLTPAQRKYTVTAADINNGSVNNTATAKGSPSTGGGDVTGTGTATIPSPATPAISLAKSVVDASGDGVAQLGETLTYTFTVTNSGNVPLTNVTISDAKLSMSNVVCVANLAVGETKTCPTKTYVVTAADIAAGKVDNLATAKGTPPSGTPVTGTGTSTIPAPATPAIKVVKSVSDASGDGVAQLGEVLTYTFTVSNTGNVPLNNVKVTDAKLGLSNADCAPSLAVGANTTCPSLTTAQKKYTVTAADISNGAVDNTVTAKGTPSTGGSDVTGTGSASIPTEGATASVKIEKSVVDSDDADSIASLGEVLTYTFKVTNTGNVDLTDVRITDAKLGLSNELCVATLPVGQTFTCPTETYTVTAADVANGSVDNIATVTGKTPTGDPVTNQGSSTIPTDRPSMTMTKSVADENPSDSVATEGEVLTYTFTVTNTGNVALTNVTVTDPKIPALASGAPCVATLAVGATTNCPLLPAATYTVTAADVAHGSVNNTATSSGTSPSHATVTAQGSATIPTAVNAPEKAGLSIDKTVDVSSASPGDVVTYTLKVKNTGPGVADNVVVTDALPSGTTFLSASAPCTQSGGTVTCAARHPGLGGHRNGDDQGQGRCDRWWRHQPPAPARLHQGREPHLDLRR